MDQPQSAQRTCSTQTHLPGHPDHISECLLLAVSNTNLKSLGTSELFLGSCITVEHAVHLTQKHPITHRLHGRIKDLFKLDYEWLCHAPRYCCVYIMQSAWEERQYFWILGQDGCPPRHALDVALVHGNLLPFDKDAMQDKYILVRYCFDNNSLKRLLNCAIILNTIFYIFDIIYLQLLIYNL